jgi:hypothetical protein
MIICVVDTTPTTANANPIFDGNQPVRRVHSAVVLDRRGIRRNRVFAHRRGIHSDRVSHQRASWRDPRPGADELVSSRFRSTLNRHARPCAGHARFPLMVAEERRDGRAQTSPRSLLQGRLLCPAMTKRSHRLCAYVLNLKCMTSPSATTYSLPSSRNLPASRAPASPPNAT